MPTASQSKLTIIGAATLCIVLFALFEVRVRPVFSLPRETVRPEPAQEARYEQCVDRRTDDATRAAFEAADNPDVQNLMIRSRQKQAIEDCRREFPRRDIATHEPLQFNLIDLRFRFSDDPPS